MEKNSYLDSNLQEIKNDPVKEDNEDGKEKEDRIKDSQLRFVLILMAFIILLVTVIPFIKTNFIDKFNYNGLVFQKTQLGDLFFYSTKFPVVGTTGRVIGDYALNFRNDPRKLDYIPINTSDGKIQFTLDGNKYGDVYISLNPFMKICNDSALSLLTLSGFLRDSGLEVKSAVTDKAYAQTHKLNYRWCHNSGFDTVIIYTEGNKTSINEIYENCYEVEFNNCEVMQSTEKFMLSILEDYAKKFKGG